MTDADIDATAAHLQSVYNGAVSAIKDRFYAPFSGQPEQSLGALRMQYNTTAKALIDTAPLVKSGEKDEAKWYQRASEASAEMRATADFTEAVSLENEVKFVARETSITVVKGANSALGSVAGGIFSAAPKLVIALGVVLFLVVAFIGLRVFSAAKAVAT